MMLKIRNTTAGTRLGRRTDVRDDAKLKNYQSTTFTTSSSDGSDTSSATNNSDEVVLLPVVRVDLPLTEIILTHSDDTTEHSNDADLTQDNNNTRYHRDHVSVPPLRMKPLATVSTMKRDVLSSSLVDTAPTKTTAKAKVNHEKTEETQTNHTNSTTVPSGDTILNDSGTNDRQSTSLPAIESPTTAASLATKQLSSSSLLDAHKSETEKRDVYLPPGNSNKTTSAKQNETDSQRQSPPTSVEAEAADIPTNHPSIVKGNRVVTDGTCNENTEERMSISKRARAGERASYSSSVSPTTKKIKIENKIVPQVASNVITKKKNTGPTTKRKRSSSLASSSSSSITSLSSFSPKPSQSSGRWTHGEHQAFLVGLKECGREWKKVASRIPTRTSAQIRSHAQKYFAKLQRDQNISPSSAMTAGSAAAAGGFLLTTPFMADGKSRSFFMIEADETAVALTASVRRNVERIVSNPRAAQREVEDTLEALRERYRQLQERLENRRRLHRQQRSNEHHEQEGPTTEESTRGSSPSSAQSSAVTNKTIHLLKGQQKFIQQQVRMRRHPLSNYDDSSVASNVSSIAGSRSNEEIIALEVLGGTLPRGNSSTSLQLLAATAGEESSSKKSNDGNGTIPRRMSHGSVSSSLSSFRKNCVVNESKSSIGYEVVPCPRYDNNGRTEALVSTSFSSSSEQEHVDTMNIKVKKITNDQTKTDLSTS